MQGIEVGIDEILNCREKRVVIQNEMIRKYKKPVISFTMNIPGPIKTNNEIKKAFDIGKNLILEKLKENNTAILEIQELNENTGNELFISVESQAEKIKDITVTIEESSELGRLFDIDVIDVNFEKLSRKSFRKCLICEEQAQECGRSRKHSVEELQSKVEEILSKDFDYQQRFPTDFKPYQYFGDYLKKGYYPFFLESEETYYQRLKQLVRLIVEMDMAEIKGLDIRQSKKILQLLYIISQQVPFSPNLSDLSRKTTIHRNSLNDYLYYLEEARLLHLLQPKNYSVASLQKPEKIYLNNTNLLYALSEENPNSGTIREVFFYNQLSGLHNISQSKEADFLVDNKYTFEVGGKNKTTSQIQGVENSWLVKDDIVHPVGRAIPLWLFGFLY